MKFIGLRTHYGPSVHKCSRVLRFQNEKPRITCLGAQKTTVIRNVLEIIDVYFYANAWNIQWRKWPQEQYALQVSRFSFLSCDMLHWNRCRLVVKWCTLMVLVIIVSVLLYVICNKLAKVSDQCIINFCDCFLLAKFVHARRIFSDLYPKH